jgi:hypothetical protein
MKTNELVGAALDWAVAKCEGMDYSEMFLYKPSELWETGGLIIQHERISLWCDGFGDWEAKQYGKHEMWASTPLVAAMRCYVASKLGDEVQLPEEVK